MDDSDKRPFYWVRVAAVITTLAIVVIGFQRLQPLGSQRFNVFSAVKRHGGKVSSDGRTVSFLFEPRFSSSDEYLSLLREIGRIPAIESLELGSSLGFSCITDDAIKVLVESSQLRRLTLAGESLSESGAASLGQLRQIRRLDLMEWQLTPPLITAISHLSDLREITFEGCTFAIGAEKQKIFEGLQSLEIFTSVGTQFDEDSFVALSQLKTLRTVNVPSSGVTCSMLDAIANERSMIQVLAVAHNTISSACIASIEKMQSLKTLIIDSPLCEEARRTLPHVDVLCP